MPRSDRSTTSTGKASIVEPYVVPNRIRRAVDALDDAPTPKPTIGVLSDATSMQDMLTFSLRRDYKIVSGAFVPQLSLLAHGKPVALIAADLYTLRHIGQVGLSEVEEEFPGVPLLVISQEERATLEFSGPSAILPLPASPSDIRRMAAALMGNDADCD